MGREEEWAPGPRAHDKATSPFYCSIQEGLDAFTTRYPMMSLPSWFLPFPLKGYHRPALRLLGRKCASLTGSCRTSQRASARPCGSSQSEQGPPGSSPPASVGRHRRLRTALITEHAARMGSCSRGPSPSERPHWQSSGPEAKVEALEPSTCRAFTIVLLGNTSDLYWNFSVLGRSRSVLWLFFPLIWDFATFSK